MLLQSARGCPSAKLQMPDRRAEASNGCASCISLTSICVHRDDAGTLSYTEVQCDAERVSMGYSPGYPCQASRIAVDDLVRLLH
jgi:hypothetical protein